MIENLFYELIRVAIGNGIRLTRSPNKSEWDVLYTMARKQSLLGVCFVGVQKLQSQQQTR